MPRPAPIPLIAVDIGNSRTKLGLFEDCPAGSLPVPVRSCSCEPGAPLDELARWLGRPPGEFAWRVASVNRAGTARLLDWLEPLAPGQVYVLRVDDVPLLVEVPEPAKVGIDRLVNVVAVNRLRDPMRGAIVVDLGSAITVDVVSANGAFTGGAILPGVAMSAKALHQFTDLLPLEPMTELAEPPPVRGTSTLAALRAGLYWGAIGAVRELVARLGTEVAGGPLYVTGGAGPSAARLLQGPDGAPALLVPHLTLAGVALCGATSDASRR